MTKRVEQVSLSKMLSAAAEFNLNQQGLMRLARVAVASAASSVPDSQADLRLASAGGRVPWPAPKRTLELGWGHAPIMLHCPPC